MIIDLRVTHRVTVMAWIGDHIAAMAWRLSRRRRRPSALRGQLFSRQLPEARSGSNINRRGARYRSGDARALVGAAFGRRAAP